MAQISGKQLRDNTVTKAKTTTEIVAADGSRAFTADQSHGGFKITSLGTPTAGTDAATKAYADSIASGVDWKNSARLATAAALPANTAAGSGVGKTLTANANGALTVDGVVVALNDRVLVKDEATAANNGVYTQTQVGTAGLPFILTRATDSDQDAEVTGGAAAWVNEGTANGDTGWILTTNDPIVVDTTALAFTQFTALGQVTAGAGLTKSGATLDVGAGNGIQVNADSVEVLYGAVGVITTVNGGDAASAGAANTAARSDHEHAVATAAAVAVGTANSEGASTSLARADHVHDAPAPSSGNKNLTASVTASDNDQATATTVAATPALDGHVAVLVNGVSAHVGDGTKASVDCYFSGDAGVTARAISAIAAGDTLHWNGSVAGFQLAATDKIDFAYEV